MSDADNNAVSVTAIRVYQVIGDGGMVMSLHNIEVCLFTICLLKNH